MINLRDIFDKVTHSSDKWEPYFEIYEKHLDHVTNFDMDREKIVEVGVQKGGSLEMWSEYYGPRATIIGIDNDPECAKLEYEQQNIEVVIGDQGDSKFWDEFLPKHPDISVFIDDGGHTMEQQITTFRKVFPALPIGAVYFCEDTHTSYMANNQGGLQRAHTFIEFSKSLIDAQHIEWHEEMNTYMNGLVDLTKGLTSISFYDSMVVFEKFGKRNMQRVFPK
jgi:hypothetical protein